MLRHYLLMDNYSSRAYADLENMVGSLTHTCSLKKGEALSLGKLDANSCSPLLLLLLHFSLL